MPNEPKLRGQSRRRKSPHPIGQIPPSLAVEIGKHIVHRLAVGQSDIEGNDFGVIFAKSINGEHKGKPLGVADVSWENCAWSVKTVKDDQPFTQKRIRAISGRNSPVFSSGVENPFTDIQATGASVLSVWNARVDESLSEYDDLRIFIMVRNMSTLEFTLIESSAAPFVAANYIWKLNKAKNFLGMDATTNEHCFTWQPHGSQFTVIHHIPASAYRFRITHRPPMIAPEHVLRLAKFEDSWIEPVIINPPEEDKIIKLET
jgi:hypothetical protein